MSGGVPDVETHTADVEIHALDAYWTSKYTSRRVPDVDIHARTRPGRQHTRPGRRNGRPGRVPDAEIHVDNILMVLDVEIHVDNILMVLEL